MDNITHRLCEIAVKVEPVARCRVVAALIRRNKIFAIGTNSYKSISLARRYAKHELATSTHAEIAAIHCFLRKYPERRISDYSLYVIRVLADGKIATAKPCKGCQAAIYAFGIKDVIYT